MKKTASMSEDRRYRYALGRSWAPERGRVCWIMLNPSTADADFDDPTIRRCIRFTESFGRGELVVVNLCAYLATKPRELVGKLDEELVGPHNDSHILRAVEGADVVVAAWGSIHQALWAIEARTLGLLRRTDAQLRCLTVNGDGRPGHPLYIAKDRQLVPWPTPTNPVQVTG